MNNGNSSNAGGAIAGLVFVILAALVICLITQPMGFGTPADKALIWDYGHGRYSHLEATDKQIDSFYKKVMAKSPDKRSRCQKYKKSMMRREYGYEYESDSAWNKKYKQIITEEVRAWRKKHGK